MEYKKEFEDLSKYWYNDGLKKARIRELSGAIESLQKSLLLNKKNVDARNLLGLCYYGRGEVGEALLEWIISKNFQAHGNIAEYYVARIEKSASELKNVNVAIQNYNKCLVCCERGNFDMAILQLRKVLEVHESFVRAWQLLGLLYIKTNQYVKAGQVLKKAKSLDVSDPLTLEYLSAIRGKDTPRPRSKKKEAVSYKVGNETIIEPLPPIEDSPASATFLNILIGFLVGVAAVWFLILPAVDAVKGHQESRRNVAYSQEIAAQKAQTDALKKELKGYREKDAAQKKEDAEQGLARDSYEDLLKVQSRYFSGNYDVSEMADALQAVDTGHLGEEGIGIYSRLKEALSPQICNMYYNAAVKAYREQNLDAEISALKKIIEIDEDYGRGEALMALGDAYIAKGDKKHYTKVYQKVIDKFPGSWYAQRAIKGQQGEPTGIFGPAIGGENLQQGTEENATQEEGMQQ